MRRSVLALIVGGTLLGGAARAEHFTDHVQRAQRALALGQYEEALRAYTAGSAYAAFEDKEKGTITPGKLADFVVLSQDLFSTVPERIKEARVVATIVGGTVVYEGN